MKILYRQSFGIESKISALADHGIDNCYFKSIKQTSGDGNGARKRHSHTGFEFHIMINGNQCYEDGSRVFSLDGGKILAIPKGVPHSLVSVTYPIEKYAFTFAITDEIFDTECVSECVMFPITPRILSNIRTVESFDKDFALKDVLIENIVFETVSLLLSEMRCKIRINDHVGQDHSENVEMDERVELAIQFIKDNVERPLRLGEVASYCYISDKQLNRLFLRETGTTVSSFIRQERLRRAEELLSTTSMSIFQISGLMGFPDEHGFSIFFKKYNGMPPGEYRKMTKSGK